MNIYILLLVIFVAMFVIDKYSTENFSSVAAPLNSSNENNLLMYAPFKNGKKRRVRISEHFNSDEFDVHLIHMAKNTERLLNFNNYYYNSDMKFKKFEIFPAVVGKDINLVDFVSAKGYQQILMTEKTKKRLHHYDLTRGAVGCYLSHMSIYKKLIESNLKYSIIFEDDVIMAADFYERLLYGLSVIPNDWDMLLLGVMCLKCDIEKDYIVINRFWGTHGYVVKKEGAVKLIEYLDKPLSKQIDADMSLLIKRGLIKVYGINPIIVAQDTKFGSDIQEIVEDSDEAFEEEFKQNDIDKIQAKSIIDATYPPAAIKFFNL
jgi:GR25 family glycosyltransferase involved in LPS biosynthesis